MLFPLNSLILHSIAHCLHLHYLIGSIAIASLLFTQGSLGNIMLDKNYITGGGKIFLLMLHSFQRVSFSRSETYFNLRFFFFPAAPEGTKNHPP